MSMISTAEFWLALLQIILINIVLSGDNAVVIALAARSLPPAQQKKAVLFGSGAAVVAETARKTAAVVATSTAMTPTWSRLGDSSWTPSVGTAP